MKAYFKGKYRTVKIRGKRINVYLAFDFELPILVGTTLTITQLYGANQTGELLEME